MDVHSTRELHIRIIDALLGAIEGGGSDALRPVASEILELRTKLANAAPGEAPVGAVCDELRLLLNRDASVAREVRHVIARITLHYLNEQIAHFSRVASERELTEEEKRFGGEHLTKVTEALRDLLD